MAEIIANVFYSRFRQFVPRFHAAHGISDSLSATLDLPTRGRCMPKCCAFGENETSLLFELGDAGVDSPSTLTGWD